MANEQKPIEEEGTSKKAFWKIFELLQWLFLGHVMLGRGATHLPPVDGMGQQTEGFWERVTEMFPSLTREDERGIGAIFLRYFSKSERKRFYSDFGEEYVSKGFDFKRLLIDIWKLHEDHAKMEPDKNPAIILIKDILSEYRIEDQIDVIRNTGIMVKVSALQDLIEYRQETGMIFLLLLLAGIFGLIVVFWSIVNPGGSIWSEFWAILTFK